jgi:hypothetical protein
MPRLNSLLFIEPELHLLIYGSCVMRKVVAAHRRPEHSIVELAGWDASPNKIDAAIDSADPIFIFGVGHGAPHLYSVECKAIYMRVCDARTAKMAGRVVHLNSCLTARQLGPDLINKGALTYYGSRDEFWLYVGDAPCSTRAVEAVFLAEYQVEASLMDGRTTGQAQEDRLKRYDEEIDYWTRGPGKDHPDAALIVRLLEIDKSIAVMLGRADVRVTSPAPKPVLTAFPAPFIALPLALGLSWFGSASETHK